MLRRLPLAYVVIVGALALTRALAGWPAPHDFALTPDRLAAGKLWLFATSALIISGPALAQLATLVPTMLLALRRLGAAAVLLVMVVAHVGATLLAYGLLQLATGDPDGSRNPGFDFGISAVWLGVLAALAVSLLPAARRREPRALIVVGLALVAVVSGVSAFPMLASTEHGLAFALGAGTAALLLRSAGDGEPRVGRLDPAHPRGADELHRLERRGPLDVEADSVAVLDCRDGA